MLTSQDTKHIADLIKIAIPDDSVTQFTNQLNTALDSVAVLKELDTNSVTETSQTHGLTNVWRADIAETGLDISKYPNKKNLKGKYFVVKKVL